MNDIPLWQDRIFQETAVLIFISLVGLSLFMFLVRNKNSYFTLGWASIKSWLFLAPLILVALALPTPGPLIFLTIAGILSAKTFFQMVGIYHRSWFVWSAYAFIAWLGYLTYHDDLEVYNLTPMIFLGSICLIPLLRNSAAHMIQYIALSLLAFIFWGWSLMHLGFLLMLDKGAFLVLYLYLLTEVSDNVSLAVSRTFGKIKPFEKISHRVTIEGLLVSIAISVLLAWGMRHLLPDRSERFWLAAGVVAAVIGRLGGLTLSMIRRDLGIKNTGIFIIGRGDILSRTEKLIFVGPIYFYIYIYLQQVA